MYVIIKHDEWRSVHEADWNWQRRLIEGTILCMDMTCLPFNSRQRCGWDKMPKNITRMRRRVRVVYGKDVLDP